MKYHLASLLLPLGLLFLSLLWRLSPSPWVTHQGYLPSSLCSPFGLAVPVVGVPKQTRIAEFPCVPDF